MGNLNFKLRIVFRNIFFWDLEIWKKINRTFWKKTPLNKEQIGNSESFPVTNLPVYLINSEHIGISEQFCDDQNVPYYQVWLYHFFVLLLNRNIVFSKPQKTSLAEECVYLYTFYPFSWCPKDTRAYHFRRPCPKWSFKRGRAKKKSIIIITYTSAVRDLSQILETISILDSVVIFLDPLRSFTKMAKVQK